MYKNKSITEFITKMKEDLPLLFRRYRSISAAYLFGSTVQTTARSIGDIDIAIRIDGDLSTDSCHDLRIRIVDDLEKYFDRKVDVVLLNTASLKMIRQVLVTGELLFMRDLEKELDYAVRKQKEYFDFKYYIDKDIQEMRTYFGAPKDVRP